MLPLMHTQGSRLERAVESLQIANQLADTGEREVAIQFIKMMAGKLLSGDEYEQVVQAFARQRLDIIMNKRRRGVLADSSFSFERWYTGIEGQNGKYSLRG